MRAIPEGYHLLDMGSSNGVYVRDQKVDDAILHEGDTFAIGDAFIRILEDDIPPTLAMSGSAARQERMAAILDPTPTPAMPPQAPRIADLPALDPSFQAPPPARSLMAPTVLGASSIVVGLSLILGSVAVGRPLGAVSLLFSMAGLVSVSAGIGQFMRAHWARQAHFGLFALWALSCVLAPFGAMGLAYQLRGEGKAETDSFFALALGLAAMIGIAGIVAAVVLVRFYYAGPVPTPAL